MQAGGDIGTIHEGNQEFTPSFECVGRYDVDDLGRPERKRVECPFFDRAFFRFRDKSWRVSQCCAEERGDLLFSVFAKRGKTTKFVEILDKHLSQTEFVFRSYEGKSGALEYRFRDRMCANAHCMLTAEEKFPEPFLFFKCGEVKNDAFLGAHGVSP